MRKDIIKKVLDGSWTNNNKTITMDQLLDITKQIPINKIPVDKLKGIALHSNNPDEEESIEKSNLKYPILVFINDDGTIKYIVDGHHRIQKAIKYNLPTIDAKLIKFSRLPKDFQDVLG
jgi:hypothetical protein